MIDDNNLKKISALIRSYLPNARIILFGSRAKYHVTDKWSDYDLLIILDKQLTREELIHWTGFLNKILVDTIQAPFDILIKSESEVDTVKEFPGHIIRHAMEEGVAL